jgi:hypothetical protein
VKLQVFDSVPTNELVFNGLDGSTGDYLLSEVEAELAHRARGEELDPAHLRDLRARAQAGEATFGVVGTVDDPNDLTQTGWGVVFASSADASIRQALGELLDWRKRQASGSDERRYQEYSGQRGYHAGETKEQFLRDRRAGPSGPADPDQMPYYLLLVGSPEEIPYSFQYQLDVQYAVGRIHFDSLEAYAAYARSVVTAEAANPRPARVGFFGVANPDDAATRLSADLLVAPLAAAVAEWQARPSFGRTPWQIQTTRPGEATKGRLSELLGGPETPALLFTASHGLGFPSGDSRQEAFQGALVCQDWPGPHAWPRGESIPREHYFAAEDVSDDARLLGMVAFHFACYGVGTPRLDDYPQIVNGRLSAQNALGTRLAQPIAPRPFVARLPQRLLGHPRGGALAVVGHVERALGSSFVWRTEGGAPRSNLAVFEGGLSRLLRGYRVGAAIETFNERYAEVSAALSDEIREIEQFGKIGDPVELARMWTASADARGYAIFGDPAVRLSINPSAQPVAAIAPVSVMHANDIAAENSATQEPTGARLEATAPAGTEAPTRAVRVDIDSSTGRIRVTTPLPVEQPGRGEDEVEFGLIDEARGALSASLKRASEQLGNALANLISDVTSLEVATYVSDQPESVKYDARQHSFNESARQVAMTCVRADGDVVALVPRTENGAVDRELWDIHSEVVERARAQRAEMIKAIGSAVGSLLGVVRPGL